MTLHLFDSKSQQSREFQSIRKGEVGIYLCGPTVQSSPHLGHLRSALVYDQLRRWLEASGFDVTLIRNVTDIDDKVLQNAKSENRPWWELAYGYELEFSSAYRRLKIAAPNYEPRATANVLEMIELIQRLIDQGFAYQIEGSADVYFSAATWKNYGELTNQKLDDLVDDENAQERGKRDPRDFALWKSHKDSEPVSASWNSPFGKGRPGWHIECSAMSVKYLGTAFDIHGGGLDLRFPHHENELAQSSAAGYEFANYWLHNGLVNVAGQKMSKSLGNSILVSDVLHDGNALALRYYLGSAHYRSVLDYNEGVLEEAEAAIERISTFLQRAKRRLEGTKFFDSLDLETPLFPEKFSEAMNDDMNIPAALAALHESIRAGNSALDEEQLQEAANALAEVTSMVNLLDINPEDAFWQQSGSASEALTALDGLIASLIEQRNAARINKDFETSDRIRDQLKAVGVVLEDSADSTHWSLGG
ncbi:MAG: cysteine--tRNA ligase [Actinomycetota bacterium]